MEYGGIMATVLLMKPLIEVRADYGFIFLLKIRKEVLNLCVIFKENQSGNIALNVRVVPIFYRCVCLWYRLRAMCQQSVILIFAWNTVLVTANVRKYGERRCLNEIDELR